MGLFEYGSQRTSSKHSTITIPTGHHGYFDFKPSQSYTQISIAKKIKAKIYKGSSVMELWQIDILPTNTKLLPLKLSLFISSSRSRTYLKKNNDYTKIVEAHTLTAVQYGNFFPMCRYKFWNEVNWCGLACVDSPYILPSSERMILRRPQGG